MQHFFGVQMWRLQSISHIAIICLLDEEARPQRRNRSRRRRNRGSRPEGGSTSRDRQPVENGKIFFLLSSLFCVSGRLIICSYAGSFSATWLHFMCFQL